MLVTFGAKLTHVSLGQIEIETPILPGSQQQQGLAHGALAFGIGDSAAGYAALTHLPEDQEVVTTDMQIRYLAPGRGDLLIAKGRVIKPGKRLVVVAADVYAKDGDQTRHIAMLTGTMVPVSIR